ncbi:MAG: CRISPR-associated endoribonuclease Cas6 [Sulfurovum sp.]|nr:CRISPR-associated endoribonuclease Cas6 [Sulfurovum sp.]
MKYFELKCTAYIKNDIHFTQSFEILSKYINFSMAQDITLKALHEERGFKHYNFGGLLPIEREKIYRKGNTYQFTIRALDENFIDKLSNTMRQNIDNPNLLIVETHKKTMKQFFITELYSATPVIASLQNKRFWTKEDDLMLLHKQLQDNLEKKYQDFFDEPIKATQNFIQLFELKNHRLQTIQTRKIDKKTGKVTSFRFFGNKFRIIPNEDEVSQRLAFVALACGLGEKNSFGGGFCLWN